MRVISKHSFGGLEKGKIYNVIEIDKDLYMVDLKDKSYLRANKRFFEEIN